jgi:hypothetical protein
MGLPRRFAPRNDYFLKPFTIESKLQDPAINRDCELGEIRHLYGLPYFGTITLRASSASWRLSTVEGASVIRSVAF